MHSTVCVVLSGATRPLRPAPPPPLDAVSQLISRRAAQRHDLQRVYRIPILPILSIAIAFSSFLDFEFAFGFGFGSLLSLSLSVQCPILASCALLYVQTTVLYCTCAADSSVARRPVALGVSLCAAAPVSCSRRQLRLPLALHLRAIIPRAQQQQRRPHQEEEEEEAEEEHCTLPLLLRGACARRTWRLRADERGLDSTRHSTRLDTRMHL